MKFIIEKEVFEKFPNLFVAIPIIKGFDNSKSNPNYEKVKELLKANEVSLKARFKSSKELEQSPYIETYFDLFKAIGANPLKIKPTHYALGKRVIDGDSLPNINPIVDLYNAFSINYITPFGGEDLTTVYGNFVLKFAKGDEHWLGISESSAKSPKKGDLVWSDDYDISTLSLNWRQCERTKLVESSTDGYFIMDGFKGVNDENILNAAREFSQFVVDNFGGQYEIITLDKDNNEIEIDFISKSTEGIELPKVVSQQKQQQTNQVKKEVQEYIYEETDIKFQLQQQIHKAVLSEYADKNVEINPKTIQLSDGGEFADYASNFALKFTKLIGDSPLNIATNVANYMNTSKVEGLEKVEALAPGFLNIFLDNNSYKNIIKTYDETFGKSNIGENKRIIIEFGQPNTHKAMQLGHFKSAITGLAIARMYENIGYRVIKANYYSDIGKNVAFCIWGILNTFGIKYSELNDEKTQSVLNEIKKIYDTKGVDEAAKFLDSCYVFSRKAAKEDESISKEVVQINANIYEVNNENILEIYKYTRDLSVEHQDKAFKQLDVIFDRQYPESEVWKEGREIVLANTKSELNPNGIFVPDQGAIIFKGEDYGLKTWVFLSSQGYPTYSGKDLGLAFTKFKEFPDLAFSIITTSVETVEYFKAVIKALELIDPEYIGKYTHLAFGWLLHEGKKMNTKSGRNVKYSDLIPEAKDIAKKKISDLKKYEENEIDNIAEKIAIGGVKFAILSHELHKDINYNPESFLSFTGFSAPYVTYAYARANGILNNAKYSELHFESNLNQVLNSKEETTLLKKLTDFTEMAKKAAVNRTPHIICNYVFELSELFNQFYNAHNVLEEENQEVKESRLALVYITKEVIKKGLYLLGIETVERM